MFVNEAEMQSMQCTTALDNLTCEDGFGYIMDAEPSMQ